MSRFNVVNDRGFNVTPAEHQLVVKFARRCLRELLKNEHDLLPVHWATRYHTQDIRVRTKFRSQGSRGGRVGITIDIADIRKGRTTFHEYRKFRRHPRLKGFVADDPEMVLFALVAHEVAHYWHRRFGGDVKRLDDREPHGPSWQRVYSALRVNLINPHVRLKDDLVL